jgi:YHS domain-containing protein
MFRRLFFLALPLAAVALYVGCNEYHSDQPQAVGLPEAPAAKPVEAKAEGEHPHKPGAHGGRIVEIGFDNYHAEAVFERGGVVRLYTLGKDESRVQDVERQELTAYVKEGDGEAVPVAFKPVPQPGDADGTTSQFVGQLPPELAGKAVEVTVPSIRIAGERFRFGFSNARAEEQAEPMPAKVVDSEEQQLYLTPGGRYTEADIKANGSRTAAEAFQGIKPTHDAHPQPGDKICPISKTKANAKFTWVVGGKSYEFCCPPCVDEFVKKAKEQPAEVRDPAEYVQK